MGFSDDGQDVQVRRIAATIVVVVLAGGGAWWWWHRSAEPAAVASAAATPAPATSTGTATDPPPIQHPLDPPATAATQPLAAVDPDVEAGTELDNAFDGKLAQWVVPDKLLRRLVATVDNLPRNARTEAMRPLRAPATPFAVQRETLDAVSGTERITLSKANFARYDPAVAVFAGMDAARAVDAYRRLYPLLQKTYEDLGYPGRYFNDRVVEAIDHLLETPEPDGPLVLEQPKVLYRFADADLESRSAGQKLLLRMGVDHERVVKEKLRAIRALIAKPK
jgi:hypothetical protein